MMMMMKTIRRKVRINELTSLKIYLSLMRFYSLSLFFRVIYLFCLLEFLYILNAICLRTFEMRNGGYHCFWYNDKSCINQYIQCGGGGVQFQESKIVFGSLCQVLCGDENLRI